jgi:hypothetical protein
MSHIDHIIKEWKELGYKPTFEDLMKIKKEIDFLKRQPVNIRNEPFVSIYPPIGNDSTGMGLVYNHTSTPSDPMPTFESFNSGGGGDFGGGGASSSWSSSSDDSSSSSSDSSSSSSSD